MGVRELTMGEKLYHGFYFSSLPSIWNKFHSNRCMIVEVHCLGETFFPHGGNGVDHGGEKYSIWFLWLIITFHMKYDSLKSDHYFGSSLFGGNVFPHGGRGLTMGETNIAWFLWLINIFHMKQVSLKSDHYCGSLLFRGNVFPHGGQGTMGKNDILVFMTHQYLPYETSFTQIGALFWKFTVWWKHFPHGGKGG